MTRATILVVLIWLACLVGGGAEPGSNPAGKQSAQQAAQIKVPGITATEIEPGNTTARASGASGAIPGKAAGKINVGQPLTLQQAIRVALANNPELAAGASEVDAARQERRIAMSQRWPRLHGVAGYSRFQQSQRIIPPSMNNQAGAFSRDIFTSDLVIRIPLFTGGRITNEILAAEFMRLAATHGLQRSRKELIFNVASVFYGILSQEKVIASVRFSLKTLSKHEERVRSMMQVQKAARVDLLRTQVRVANLRERLVRERNLRRLQLRLLTNLMGVMLDQGQLIAISGKLVFSGQADTPRPDLSSELATAMKARDDFMAARAAVQAQANRLNIARSKRWPQLNMQGSYGGRWGTDPTEDPVSADDSGDEARVGMTLDVPIFEGGRIVANIRKEDAHLEAARQRLRKLELRIRLEVETAVLNLESAKERVKATRTAVTQARESLRIEREKYGLGRGAIVNVLDAQSDLLDAQTRYFQALADQHTAIYQLRLATGKGKHSRI